MGKKNEENHTALHFAPHGGHENIVNFLLNVFGKEDIKILIEYVKKENKHNETSSHLASKQGHEKIVQLIPQKVKNMFKYQNIDEKKKSLASIIFDDECCRPGKEQILSFLITEYNSEIHIILEISTREKEEEKLTVHTTPQRTLSTVNCCRFFVTHLTNIMTFSFLTTVTAISFLYTLYLFLKVRWG